MKAALSSEIEALFCQQLEGWPLLKKGVDGLAAAETRPLDARGLTVLVRHIPHRVASTTAAVDRESVSKRPCFLCPGNLFPEQRGVSFGEAFTIYCNPFPVVARHLTVVHREHRPQRIEGQIASMLDLAAALPGYFVLYNGPECGASAPDHLHLQAGWRDDLPIAQDAGRSTGLRLERYGARALLFRGRDRQALVERTDTALALLSTVTGKGPEPWVNVVVFHENRAGWTVIVFPREQHRPACFHSGELLVSPASIDLCGLLVTPSAKTFAELTGEQVAGIYSEVSLNEEAFDTVLASLETH